MRAVSLAALGAACVTSAVLASVITFMVVRSGPEPVVGRVQDLAPPASETPAGASPPPPTPSAEPSPLALAPDERFPDATTTGVAGGTVLQRSGPITVTTDGAVLEDLQVEGGIQVEASGVTIRRTRVLGGSITTSDEDFAGLAVTDVEIDGRRPDGSQAVDAFTAGIGGSNFTCTRCHIHHVGHGVNLGSNVTIADSYIHDVVYSPDNGGSHNDSIVSNGGAHNVIRGNTLQIQLTPGSSAALALYGDFAPITDVLVEGNLLDGGAYCTYAGSVEGKPYPLATGVRYIDNAFGSSTYPRCGEFGPVTGYADGSGNEWTGNRWLDTGDPVTP